MTQYPYTLLQVDVNSRIYLFRPRLISEKVLIIPTVNYIPEHKTGQDLVKDLSAQLTLYFDDFEAGDK